jgi:UPF0176 protein
VRRLPRAATYSPVNILNISAYKFVSLEALPELRIELRARCSELRLKGTILIAAEGINLFLAGEVPSIEAFLKSLLADARFAGMPVKHSRSDEQPFNRLLVKLKREIIPMRRPEINPARAPAPRLAPQDLQRWLDKGREVVLLDTRNQFEVDLGTFENARSLGLKSFSDFPLASAALGEELKDKPIVTFCTGGIRCEKAAPWLISRGFRDVWQLDGGILKYFEACGGAHYRGECFVFDKRVAVDDALRETGTVQCYVCQAVLTSAERQSPQYELGVSCPHCDKRSESIAA